MVAAVRFWAVRHPPLRLVVEIRNRWVPMRAVRGKLPLRVVPPGNVQQSAGFCFVVLPPARRQVEARFHDWLLADFHKEVLDT
jgi:hypothetical protein